MKNGWFDSENKVYIIYQIAEIQEDLGFSKKKAIEYLNELESFGLVEKKRRGLGLPSILYVKSFLVQRDCSKPDFEEDGISRSAKSDTSKECDRTVKISEKQKSTSKQKQKSMDDVSDDLRSVDLGTSRGVDFDTSKSADLGTSRGAVLTPQEVSDWAPPINNTKENDIKKSNNKSNHIVSEKVSGMFTGCDCDMISEVDAYEEIIKENIGYDDLLVAYPFERETIEGIMQLFLETVLNKNETMEL